ncbi:MAG TPA: PAS domain S-box protein [bacterium]|nr:PAS domain S-box protein [bacterium]
MLDPIEKEQLLQIILRNDADPMFCKNDRLQYTMVNPAMERLLNLPSDKILGKRAAEFMEAESARILQEMDELVLQGQTIRETRIIKLDDKPRTFNFVKEPLRDEQGSITGICGLVRDITELQQAERLLRLREDRLKAQFQSIPVPTFTWQKKEDDFYLSDYNEAALKITQGKIVEMVGKKLTELYVNRPDLIDDVNNCYNEKNVFARDMSYQYATTGEKKFLSVKYAFVPPDGVLVHTEDITERKAVNEALRDSEERFRALAENAYDTIMRFDRDHRHLYVNPVVERQTGILVKDFFGKTHAELGFPPHLVDLWGEAIEKVFVEKHSNRIEFQLPSGIWIDWLLVPEMSESDEVKAVMASARDITLRKYAERQLLAALEKLREADKVKSNFISRMSHEIRTPINHIIGMASIVRMQREAMPSEEINKYLDIVMHSAEKLLEIFNAVLDLSRINRNTLDIVNKEFSPIEFLNTIAEKYRLEADNNDLQFELRLENNLPAKVIGDPVKLEQILENLLDNAVKFTNKGGVGLSAEVKQRVGDRVEMQFAVDDTGVGIPENHHEKIFEPFYQVDMSTTREFQGAGIGLAIVKELVKLLDGQVWLTSEPKAGTTFFFTYWMDVPPAAIA